MTKTMPRVGLDVHAHQTHLCNLDLATGEVERKRIGGPPETALAHLEAIGPQLVAVYEAGPTLRLARAAADRGLDVRVAAPVDPPLTERPVKTDRRDAERLARARRRRASLRPCPERGRGVLPRPASLPRGPALRSDARPPPALEVPHAPLDQLPGPGSQLDREPSQVARSPLIRRSGDQAFFVDYLSAVESLGQRRLFLDQAITELVPESPHAELVARLRCFRGIDTLSAAGICAEVGDFHRFAKPKLLAGFLGITPSERTSDERRRQGGSPRPAPSTPVACWSRPPTTTRVRRR